MRLSPAILHAENVTSVELADGSGDMFVNLAVYHDLHCIVGISTDTT